ncbi:hypothetical protein [Methylorubrum populi]
MARISFAPARATSVEIAGQRVKIPVWGDPRCHENWINHPLYKPILRHMDSERDHTHGWEIILRGSGTDKPWLISKWPLGPRVRGIGPHILGPHRPWMLVAPPGHDAQLYVYPSLQEAVNVILNPPEERARGRLGRFADHGDEEHLFTDIRV